MLTIVLAVALLLAIVGAPALIAGSTFNRLIALETRCDTANADVDVLLKRRSDLLPALVETVKGASRYEADTLTALTKARAEALAALTPELKLRAEQAMSANVTQLLATGDRMPELKASAEYVALRGQLSETEDRLAAARRFYNLAAEEYNATLRQFPSNLIAARRRLSSRRPFDLGVGRLIADEAVAIKF